MEHFKGMKWVEHVQRDFMESEKPTQDIQDRDTFRKSANKRELYSEIHPNNKTRPK